MERLKCTSTFHRYPSIMQPFLSRGAESLLYSCPQHKSCFSAFHPVFWLRAGCQRVVHHCWKRAGLHCDSLNESSYKNSPVVKTGDACDQYPHEPQPVTVSQSQRNLVYLPNQLMQKRRNERPVWHQLSPPIISVPIFHQDHSILQPYGGLLP